MDLEFWLSKILLVPLTMVWLDFVKTFAGKWVTNNFSTDSPVRPSSWAQGETVSQMMIEEPGTPEKSSQT